MRTALIFLVILLALPAVAAQTIPAAPTPCGPISIPAAPVAPLPVATGQRADIVVAVANGGQTSATVTVTADTATPGWTFAATPTPNTIPRTETRTFTFTLEAGPEATTDAVVTFAASGTCDSPLGAQCGAACNAGTANEQVVIPFRPDEGFTVPFVGDLNIPLEYLIAGVVLIGLASAIPFLMRRSKGGIVAQCPEPLKMVKPGRGTSFPIELRNGTKESATAQFEVGAVPEGWSAFMPLPEVQLAARESRSLWLMVRSPATAGNGDAVDVELRLRDPRGKDGGLVKVRAEVQGAGEA